MNHHDPADGLRSGHVVSDLHLFAHRSEAGQQMSPLRQVAGDGDFLVLNGDIFDFRWTTLAGTDETAHAAVDWLASLVLGAPGCDVFYVLGNHDRMAFFAHHLEALSQEAANFHWHPTHVRIGSCLFLHGDLVFDRACEDPFGVALGQADRVRGVAMNLGYRALIATRAHRVAHPFFYPRRCARRITQCLQQAHPELADGVSDVYFGHTHRSFTDFRYNGMMFHNTGSAVRHMASRLLPVQV